MNSSIDKPFSLLKKIVLYVRFWSLSKNRHGVHSPFVFDFVENVLNPIYSDKEIEKQRDLLLKNKSTLFLNDHGQGKDRDTTIAAIAKTSLKKPKEAQLLAKMVSHYSIQKVIELGTSFGISTSYMARSCPSARVITVEASKEVLEVARSIWASLDVRSIDSIHSEFDSVLEEIIQSESINTLYFIDGNHRYEATINYFEYITKMCNENSILVFDDIHWSAGMEKAWDEISESDKITLSIDLFEMGIVFMQKRLKKEHFYLRY